MPVAGTCPLFPCFTLTLFIDLQHQVSTKRASSLLQQAVPLTAQICHLLTPSCQSYFPAKIACKMLHKFRRLFLHHRLVVYRSICRLKPELDTWWAQVEMLGLYGAADMPVRSHMLASSDLLFYKLAT